MRTEFLKFYSDMTKARDIDPAFPVINELFRRYELSLEQRYWVAFIYTMFYHNATTFLFMQEFPELEKVDIGRLTRWYAANGPHLQFQKDRKAIRCARSLVTVVDAYKRMIGGNTQHEFFMPYAVSRDTARLWKTLNSVPYIGRHAALAWWETLVRCVELPLGDPDPQELIFHPSAESSYTGLIYATGLAKPTLTDLDSLLTEADGPRDYMYAETVLCAFKKLVQQNMYIGYYIDRMSEEIRTGGEDRMSKISKGVDWNVLWDIRKTVFPHEYLGELAPRPWYGWRKELKRNDLFKRLVTP